MSLSAMPRALARAISLPALLARSFWAADAVGFSDSTPADRNAISGLFDTIASPLLNTPGVKVGVDCGTAPGAATTIWVRIAAMTANVTATAHAAAMAPENRTGREGGQVSFVFMKRKRRLAPRGNKRGANAIRRCDSIPCLRMGISPMILR